MALHLYLPAHQASAQAPPAPESVPPAHDDALWQRGALSGNWGGFRDALENKGIILGADSIDDFLGDVAGGIKSGATYEGRLEVLATLDLDRLFGWSGAVFHVNAFQIHGRGLSANYLNNNLMTVSSIEARRATRLFDCWIEQAFLKSRLSVRAGQIAADDEFFTSQYAGIFINSTFGWPAIMTFALPSGGPAYPLATPGLRVKLAASDKLTLAVALFNGDPAGPGPGSPERRDPDGLGFRTGDDAFMIAEAAYAINQDKDASGLPATYKIGGWSHTGRFADERIDASGLSLASPASSGAARMHRNDFGAYAVLDQLLWRRAGMADQGLAMFARVAGSPSDRNLIDLYGDLGMTFKGPVPARGDDVIGFGFSYAKISDRARAFDRDVRAFGGADTPPRDYEAVFELTYRFQATPWWALQFDLQHIFHPGANAAASAGTLPATPVADTTIAGLRSSIVF